MKKLLLAAGLLALGACNSGSDTMHDANPQPVPGPSATPNGGNPLGGGSSSVPGGATESTQ